MVVHHALVDPGFLVGDGGAHCRDDAAGLVTGDHAGRPLDATRDDSTRIGRGAVVVQVAAAHARGLDLEDHVARAGCGIGEALSSSLRSPETRRLSWSSSGARCSACPKPCSGHLGLYKITYGVMQTALHRRRPFGTNVLAEKAVTSHHHERMGWVVVAPRYCGLWF